MVLKHADLVLAGCHTVQQELAGEVDPERVVLVEHAPLAAVFQEDREGAARLREQLDLGKGPVVVYTGNFDAYQGLDLLVRAAGQVVKRISDVRFVLVGGVEAEITRYRELVAKLGLEAVCLFAGERPVEEIPAFMTLASVLVAPRVSGGSQTVTKLYTYMQSGKPIVATRLAEQVEVLDEQCALLVLPQPDDLAEGIVRAIREPLLSDMLGKEARARVGAHYSLSSFKHKLRNAYRDLENRGRE
jgi:glycosyltransferase involved in cell wall biosynthesis